MIDSVYFIELNNEIIKFFYDIIKNNKTDKTDKTETKRFLAVDGSKAYF